jgi:PAS domain S-box-containing protein
MKNFQYKTFAEAMPQMAFISDPEGNIVYYNKRWYDYIGQLPGTEGWGWENAQIHHPEDLQRTIDRWKNSLQTGNPYEIEYRLRRYDGEYRWHLGRAMPIRDANGDIRLWLGTNTDIHVQKVAEEALKLEHDRLEAIIENMGAGAVIMDPHGRMLSMNKAALRLHGFESKDEMYLHFEQFKQEFELKYPDGTPIPLDDWPFRRAMRDDYIRDFEVDLNWKRKNHQKFVNYTVVPINDSHGKLVNLIFTMTDLTEKKKEEENLSQSEKRLRIASAAAELGIFEWNINKNICHWENNRMYEIFSRSKADGPIPKDEFLKNVIYPEDLEKFERSMAKALHSESSFYLVGRIFGKDSEIRWVEFTGQFDKGVSGMPERMIGVVRDITEQHELEENLKTERELLYTIYDSIPVMLTIWDPRLDVLSFNKAFVEITGWTMEDREKNIMELVYPDPEYRKEVGEFMNSLAPGFRDFKMSTKTGNTLESTWANVKISDGRYVGIGLDISERKEFEKQLSELSNQLQTVVDNIIDGVIMYGPDGEIIKINNAAMEILPVDSDVQGNPNLQAYNLYDTNGKAVSRDRWPKNRCLQGEHFIREEYCMQNALDKKNKYLEFSGIPVYENGRILFAVITINDISQRKNEQIRIEKVNRDLKDKNRQLEKMGQLHENLLYIIAHDLRGPITSMSLILEVLNTTDDRNKELEMVSSLQRLVKRQKNIINGLIEIIHVQTPEKIKAGKIVLEDIVRDIIREHEGSLEKYGCSVKYNFKEISTIYHVESFINSILKNLISNSIKYRKESVPLELEIRSTRKNGYILISVKDNGIGIDLEKHRDELFKPFKRFTNETDGTGIGLYLIRSLIEKNGGYIELKSSPDKGTIFYCFLKEYEMQEQEMLQDTEA